MSAVRPEVYPPVCDWEGDHVIPATDGHPWRKACDQCAFRWNTEAHAVTGMSEWEATDCKQDRIFYCVHRVDQNDQHRVCACYAACRAGAGMGPPTGPLIDLKLLETTR